MRTLNDDRISRIGRLLILVLLALLLSGCRWLLSSSVPVSIVVASESFVLAWDSDEPQLPDQPPLVDHYNVYYRPYGALEWRFLRATVGSRSLTTIGSWDLGFGRYEFAVQEVYRDGRSSGIHASSDSSAWPAGGWYIDWRAPEGSGR